jgi:hypothetical protein
MNATTPATAATRAAAATNGQGNGAFVTRRGTGGAASCGVASITVFDLGGAEASSRGDRAGSGSAGPTPSASRAASTTAVAVRYRASGSFAIAFSTTASSAAGSPGRSSLTGRAESLRWA